MHENEWTQIRKFKRPDFPVEIFPKKMRDLLIQYHNSSGCPVDYAACVMIGTVVAAVYDRFSIKAKVDRKAIPLTLYQFIIGDSGSMKSAPFGVFPDKLQTMTAMHNAKIATGNKYVDETLSGLKKKLANTRTNEQEKSRLYEEIERMEKRRKPFYPFIRTDVTMESLAIDAQKSGECVSIFSSESTVVNAISGMTYTQKGSTPNIDLILKGYDGESVSISRAGKEPVDLLSPRISLCIAGQKTTLDTLTTVGEQVERGFPNRCLFYIPEGTFNHDATKEIPVDQALFIHWEYTIETLFNSDRGRKIELTLDDEARRLYNEYRNFCTEQREKAKYYGEIKGWIGKQADKALRFSAILLLMDNPDARVITADVFTASKKYFNSYALPMALIAYHITGEELTDQQARVIAKARDITKRKGSCTEGDLRDVFRKTKDEQAFDSVINYLKKYDYIRIREEKTSTKPRKIILINPTYQD